KRMRFSVSSVASCSIIDWFPEECGTIRRATPEGGRPPDKDGHAVARSPDQQERTEETEKRMRFSVSSVASCSIIDWFPEGCATIRRATPEGGRPPDKDGHAVARSPDQQERTEETEKRMRFSVSSVASCSIIDW